MLSLLASGAAAGVIRCLLEPDTILGIGVKAKEWKGLLFNAIVGAAGAWLLTSGIGREGHVVLGFLTGYVVSDVLDSILYILLKPYSKKKRL